MTVLFADLVGFTTLSERRDPEQVKRLIDSVFERLVRDVESHGGVVDKILGDALIALFGAPVAHEDDADRAVRAALAMQRSVRQFRDEHPADAVRMRIGINTGEVLVGTLAGTEYTAMGDVVNTASRLQELAHPDSVLIGEATRELCGPAIHLQRVRSVQLRGREQETTVWRAVAVETSTVARRWGSDVSFVGRASEVEMMSAITWSVLSGRGAIVSVSGEAGIGKSRLVSEAIAPFLEARPDTVLLEGACAPYGESNVWWPVTGGLLASFGLDRNAPAEESRRRFSQRLAALDDYTLGTSEFERVVELVLHLLGQPSALDSLGPTSVRDAVVAGIVDAIRRRAIHAPVVIWVDDLQWAAPVLLDLLETVARQLADLPVLIVTTCRPDDNGTSEWPPPVDPALTLHLSLDALDAASSIALVREAAGKELPDEVIAGISSRSGGNPLFLIELARLAAASNDPSGGELPGTLRALIAARLDLLGTSQRQVLDNAAIIGNRGRVAALSQFASELGQQFDPLDLDALGTAGLLVRQGTRWQFRSDVVREVAYQTLTKYTRAQRHAGVARYLSAYEPGLYDRRAHHSATAAELRSELGPITDVPDDIVEHAVELLACAAEGWAVQGAHRRALQLIERALALDAGDDEVRRRLMLFRVESLVDVHELRAGRVRADELRRHAAETGDRVLTGEAERLLGTIEQTEGNLVTARVHLTRAVDQFRDIGDIARLAEALRARGFAEVFGGSLTDADRFLDEAERRFGEVADPRGSAWVNQHRAWVSFLAGDHAASERRLLDAIAAFDDLEDRAGRTWSQGLLAYVFHFLRRNDEALALAFEVLTEAKRWGDEWGSAMMLNLQATVRLWRGELEVARALAERSLAGFRKIDDRFGMIQALSTLTRSNVALGRAADADRAVEEVLVLSGAFGKMAYPLLAAAGTAMHLGHGERATALASNAVERLDTTGANVDEGHVVASFGMLLSGDADGALARLLQVDVDRSPFALAARATARVVLGDREGALKDVRSVEALEDVSYWDRAVAAIAGAAAAVDDEGHRRQTEVTALIDELEDVVVSTYAAEVVRGLDGGDPAGDARRAFPIGGWATVARRLVQTPDRTA